MDLKKIKDRLQELSRQGQGSPSKKYTWKPSPGTNLIRIVPYTHNRDWPFLELHFHYDLAKRTIISPISFNDPDPVQELADKLKTTGEKEDWVLGKKIEPKLRTYVPVLVRGKEDEGVKFWGFGKTVYEELLKTIDDPDYGDITDLKNGSDLTVEYEVPTDGSFPKTTFRVKRNTSPATESKDVLKLLKEMPQVSDIWEVPSYDELDGLLQKFMNNSEEEAEASIASNSPANSVSSDETPPNIPEKAVTDIDKAFDEMFT